LLGAAAVELGWEKSLRASSPPRLLSQIRLQTVDKQLKALRRVELTSLRWRPLAPRTATSRCLCRTVCFA